MKFLTLLSILIFSLAACNAKADYKTLRNQAAAVAGPKDPIVIGVGWSISSDYDKGIQGIDLAVKEINANGGLLGGRKIQLVVLDDEISVKRVRRVAQTFAENTHLIAVIGHFWSSMSIPASSIYDLNGILMLSPISTSPELTRQGFPLVFRSIMNDRLVAEQFANFAKEEAYQRLVILYLDGPYGREYSSAFEDRARELGLVIEDRKAYVTDTDFRSIISTWKWLDFDAIFVVGDESAAEFIKLLREEGIEAPILAGDGLDTPRLWEIAGEAANGVVVASHFHPDSPNANAEDFEKAFINRCTNYLITATWQEKFCNEKPDTWAAQGYDAVYLLAHVIEKAKTTLPEKLALQLGRLDDWQGVTGLYSFSENGDLKDRQVVFQVLEDGVFKFLRLSSGDD
ncbi:ABC transporter substrate-binding protein [Anaerolineales bacterium]